jgi:hypothetical protein
MVKRLYTWNMINAPLTVTAARELGARAHADGRMAAPILDPAIAAAIAEQPVGSRYTRDIMRAFSAGWTAANLAAPVEL